MGSAAMIARLMRMPTSMRPTEMIGIQPQADVFRMDERVERAAEGHVVADTAEPRHLDDLIPGVDEGRHVQERHCADAPVLPVGGGGDAAGRRVHADDDLLARPLQHARVQEHLGQADDAVAAHGAEAFVVQEEHAQIAVRRRRLGEEGAVHVGVAPRLPHERRAQVVVAFTREPGVWRGWCPPAAAESRT